MDDLTKQQRTHAMKAVRSRDTTSEVRLRKALWHKGIRYRKNYKKLPGSPDIVILKCHIAIFVDGDFWHAKNYEKYPGEQIQSNKQYWIKKLKRNVERDKEINDKLTELGWLVLRFWESDIKKDLHKCVSEICEYCGKKQKE